MPVVSALLAAEASPATTVGDVAQLLDVDVQHRAAVVAFVAAEPLPGGPVEVGEPG
jgi:hypothetical protein